MRCLLSVCLAVAAGVAVYTLDDHAQTPVLQKGISVEMAVTTGGAQLSDADRPDAWIVTVTADGDLYFGVDKFTPEGLLEAMIGRPRNRGQELYVKADGHAPFLSVRRALDAARTDKFPRVYLLTAQPSGKPAGEIVSPTGMPLWLASDSAQDAVVVQISPGQGTPMLRVENQGVALKELHTKLAGLLEGRSNRVVVLHVGKVPFADVAHVVDVCNMAGATTVLGGTEI